MRKYNLYELIEVWKGCSQEFKMSKNDEREKIDSIIFKSLVWSLRVLTYTRPNIIFGVGLMSRFLETPKH